MAELETGFPDGRVIHDRQKPRRIGHHSPIEERLVMVEEIDQIDVAIEVRRSYGRVASTPDLTARPQFQLRQGRARRFRALLLLSLCESG